MQLGELFKELLTLPCWRYFISAEYYIYYWLFLISGVEGHSKQIGRARHGKSRARPSFIDYWYCLETFIVVIASISLLMAHWELLSPASANIMMTRANAHATFSIRAAVPPLTYSRTLLFSFYDSFKELRFYHTLLFRDASLISLLRWLLVLLVISDCKGTLAIYLSMMIIYLI